MRCLVAKAIGLNESCVLLMAKEGVLVCENQMPSYLKMHPAMSWSVRYHLLGTMAACWYLVHGDVSCIAAPQFWSAFD